MALFSQLFDTNNFLPAALKTLSGILGTTASQSQYDLYKQQAQEYVNAARENAQIIKEEGAIALRNLQYRNKLERGIDVATVGAKGGNMSGSNLDVVLQKEKVRRMNEAVVHGDTINKSMIEMANGYRKAASAYGTLAAKADADKWNIWNSVLSGVSMYVGLTVDDRKMQDRLAATQDMYNRVHVIERYNTQKGWKGEGKIDPDVAQDYASILGVSNGTSLRIMGN